MIIIVDHCANKVLSEDYFDFIADYKLAAREILAGMDMCYISIDDTFACLYIPKSIVPQDVFRVYGYKVFVRLLGLLDTASLEESGVTRIRNIPGLGLQGEGTFIGIVDTGIDYTHRAFLDSNNTTRIISIWDQTIQSGNPPEGLVYGTEFTKEQINAAILHNDPTSIVPSIDEIGHGTFLAGIAAGNIDEENDFSGVAPKAELVVVKLKPAKQNLRNLYLIENDAICYQENDIMLGIKYLIDVANKYNRPISICIGLGTSQGAHDMNGALSLYLSSVVQQDGVSVSIAAGNEGNSRLHYESNMTAGTDSDTAELNIGPDEKGFTLEIWGDSPNTFSIEIITPSGEYVPSIFPKLRESREIKFFFEDTTINIFFQIIGSRSGAQLVLIQFSNPAEGIWKIKMNKINKGLDLRINIWLPLSNFISKNTYFVRSNPYTTLTAPANVTLPMVITAYDNINGNLYPNASRGYTRTNQIAPDLAAPGVNLIGPYPGNTYGKRSGTSVAAAHVTGISAMLLEWGKVRSHIQYMDGIDVKNILIRGAKRSSGAAYPNREWGYGIVDVLGAFESLTGNL